MKRYISLVALFFVCAGASHAGEVRVVPPDPEIAKLRRRVVFVCDASPSMKDKLPELRDQLEKAIVGYRPIYSFNVIILQDRKYVAAFPDLVAATPERKRQAYAFLKTIGTTAQTDPMAGLEFAFAQKPQTLYLLTDHDFPDNEAVAKKIAELNKDHKAAVHTIALVGKADKDTAYQEVLKKIALAHDGTFKLVPQEELKLGAATQPANDPVKPVADGTLFDDLTRFQRITFVMDASGSMINKMASLKDKLRAAVNSLQPEQSFGLIFFQDEKCDSLSADLLPASAANQHKARAFLEQITTTGTTDPIPGLEAAFKQNPQVIYLLTDGDFPDNALVLKRITELNKVNHARIYTIALTSAQDNDTAFLELLKTIAKENGGQFKHAKADDL